MILELEPDERRTTCTIVSRNSNSKFYVELQTHLRLRYALSQCVKFIVVNKGIKQGDSGNK
jgi:hypothetical protein